MAGNPPKPDEFQNISDNDATLLETQSSESLSMPTHSESTEMSLYSTTVDSISSSSSKMCTSSCKTDNGDDNKTINPGIRTKMLARVATSNAHFKHQQRGEPDLTLEDKIEIAQNILDSSHVSFLSRFCDYLEMEDLEYFQSSRHIYEIDFYLKQIMKNRSGNFRRNTVKNRRYEAMKELISLGEYFADEEMKFREPYLYEQMIGQYLTQKEIRAKVDKSDLTFSSILLKHIDQLDENIRFGHDKDQEEGQEEEEEESDGEETDNKNEMDTAERNGHDVIGDMNDDDDDEEKPKISDARKHELRDEFLTIMEEKFLNGDDKTFDYSKVDNNENYDDLKVLGDDEEERYFNDEDPESIHSDSNL